MKKFLFLALFFVLTLTTTAGVFESSKEQYDWGKSVNIWVEVVELSIDPAGNLSERGYSFGSGVVIKKTDYTYILTCNHVVDGSLDVGYTLRVKDKDNKYYDAFVLDTNAESDLALVVVFDSLEGYEEVNGIAEPEITQKLFTVGNGLGFEDTYGEGLLVGYDHRGDYLVTTPTIFGDSGSGVFDSNGNLVGMLSRVYGGNNSIDFTTGVAVSYNKIKDFLKGFK